MNMVNECNAFVVMLKGSFVFDYLPRKRKEHAKSYFSTPMIVIFSNREFSSKNVNFCIKQYLSFEFAKQQKYVKYQVNGEFYLKILSM